MRSTWLWATLGVAMLSACAGVTTGVRATPGADLAPGEHTYALAPAPLPDADGRTAHYAVFVTQALARRGFATAPAQTAHYRVSLAYDTHAAAVHVTHIDCAASGATCDAGDKDEDVDAPAAWFGSRAYVHSLTLRFFDRASGREVYKVRAAKRDGDAELDRAMPYLVESALARVPFMGERDWEVKLRGGEEGATPSIAVVAPARE
ncbi:DUF4136 domain-containing protein [Trinickia fusca]|nr:DUF4136 domain-containing protein [Trinickia fusca]